MNSLVLKNEYHIKQGSYEHGFQEESDWVWNDTLPLASTVILGKLINFPFSISVFS